MKRLIRRSAVNFISSTLGALLVKLLPHKASELSAKGMTLVMENDLTPIERLMRRAILRKLENQKKFNTLSEFHQNFWINKGADFFSANNARLKDVHIPDSDFIFDHLEKQLTQETNRYKTLVEIGTGNGTVLDYLSTRFAKIERFVGIDLSRKQIDSNKKRYEHNPKLEFVACDAYEWVKNNGKANSIFITFMGVYEYFTETRLQNFLKMLNGLGKIMIIAIEPNGANHDFIKNPNSEIYGPERSFSHNYQNLFENAGFDIWHFSKKTFDKDSDAMVFIGARN